MWQISKQPAAFLVTGLLLSGITHGLSKILFLAISHWQQPTLFGDSFTYVERTGGLFSWLLAQHNDHRILWAKAISLLETELLRIPPGQSALFQSFALILACAGLWCWLSHRMLKRSDLRLVTTLSGVLLLVNPWQYENLGWEFQTPWFLINALVLLGALLLSVQTGGRQTLGLAAAGLPWIAIASTGQGVALAVAFATCAWLRSRWLGALATVSTAFAGITLFVFLPYSKPAGHPELSFQLDYFLRAWLGGPWQGLTVLVVVIAAVLMGRRQPITKAQWPVLLMPGLFSALFAGMITLSRSGFGVEQANSSRYITHSVMMGITALLALALTDDNSHRRSTPLLGGFLVLLTTLGSFPQGLQTGGLSYARAWSEGERWAEQKRQRLICHAEQVALATQNMRLLKPCEEIHPNQEMVERYFQRSLQVRPLGWHQQMLAATPTAVSGEIRHNLDQKTADSASLHLHGWAFLTTAPEQQLYLLIDYGAKRQFAIPLNQPRPDVQRTHHLPDKHVGFDAAIPRSNEGQPLRNVRVGTPTKAVQIWEESNADG